MIKSFKCKETEKIFNRYFSQKLPEDIQTIARRKLEMIDSSELLQDLRIPPSNHLKKLSKNRKRQCSIKINDQWRICFEWKGEDAYNLEIVDYH